MTNPKQVAVISGKGGTGKTTLLASFAALAEHKVLGDCDVDAANLYLLLHPEAETREEFYGAQVARRDATRCTGCGECERRCRFAAITATRVEETRCEGCGLCVLACPEEALRLEPVVNGTLHRAQTAYGPTVYARLHPGGENSGKLVTRVRQEAEDLALGERYPLILLDGPPGIGCTVTATLVDVDFAVVVTEPTLSGRHDLERVVALAAQLGVPVGVVVNKADLNPVITAGLREYAGGRGLPLLGEIPYDEAVVQATAQQTPLVNGSDGPAAQAVRQAWQRTIAQMSTEHR